jgi:hypothetical protein
MSRWTMANAYLPKIKPLFFAFSVALATWFTFSNHSINQLFQTQLLNTCVAVEYNLPMSHVNHPCNVVNMSNKSWLSWLSGGNKSTHLHFLDLVELIHYSFN